MRYATFLILFLSLLTAAQAQSYRSIRQVDFKNLDVGWCGGNLTLRNGRVQYGDTYLDAATLKEVKFVDFDRDGRVEAFVTVAWTTAGSSGGGMNAYVYRLGNKGLEQIWSKCNERSGFELKGNSILYDYPEYVGDDAHCCPSYLTTETYAWRGKGITRIAKKRKPSGY